MKINQSKIIEKSNFSEGNKISAVIDNPVKMLRMFTKDLYKQPLQTAIQEYIANARDAHVMAKKDTSSIEITAPTLANPVVVIKDYGTGLSKEDVVNVFARITASNKDHSDLFNGGFGIGSKSWFAINPSFVVISVYNKKKTYYDVSFSDNIYITPQLEEKTSEPNGVEVHLPLAKNAQIKPAVDAISRAIKYWPKRPKLINMEMEELPYLYQDKDFTVLSINDQKTKNGREASSVEVTLGGTIYSINHLDKLKKVVSTQWQNYSVAFHFNVGEVKLSNMQEVGPDRESFVQEMEEHLLKKANKCYAKLSTVLEKYISKSNDFENIKKVVRLREYTKRTFEFRDGHLKAVFSKSSPPYVGVSEKVYTRNCPTRFLACVSDNTIPLEKEAVLIIENDKGVELQTEKNIAVKAALKKESKYVAIILEKNSAKLKDFSKYFKIVKLSEVEYSLPVKRNLKKEKDPVINVMIEASFSTSGKYRVIQTYQKKKMSQLNKKMLIVVSDDWHRKSAHIIDMQKCVYVVSSVNFAFLKKNGFNSYSVKEIQKDFSNFLDQRTKEFEKQKKAELARREKMRKLEEARRAKEAALMRKQEANSLAKLTAKSKQKNVITQMQLANFRLFLAENKVKVESIKQRLKGVKSNHPMIKELKKIKFMEWNEFNSLFLEFKYRKFQFKQDDSLFLWIRSLKKDYPLTFNVLVGIQGNDHECKVLVENLRV